jgi:hypothetical protein
VAFGTDTWSVSGGRLLQTGTQVEPKALVWTGFTAGYVTIDSGIDVLSIVPTSAMSTTSRRRIGLATNWTSSPPSFAYGRLGALTDDISNTANASAAVYSYNSATGGTAVPDVTDDLGSVLELTSYELRSDVFATDRQWFIASDTAGTELAFVSDGSIPRPTGTAGPYTFGVTAGFRYVVIFTREF